jgi:hypothetical protein
MRGIALISAVTIASEIGAVSRFQNARQLMSYSGTVPSENSSGKRTQRGGITKSGNAHLRRILGEAAWSYRRKPAIGPALRKRQESVRNRSGRLPGRRRCDSASAMPGCKQQTRNNKRAGIDRVTQYQWPVAVNSLLRIRRVGLSISTERAGFAE